jgi:hypothetical protein
MSNNKTDLAKANKRLAQVIIELAEAKAAFSDPAREHERVQLKVALDDAQGEQNSLQAQVLMLERLIKRDADIADADATIKACRKKIAVAAKDLSSLEAKRAKVTDKLNKVVGEVEQVTAKAVEGEKLAAQAYAEALSTGDASAEQAAQTKLERASDLVDEAQRKEARQQTIVTAMQNELSSIESAVASAVQAVADLETEQLEALRAKLSSDWNGAARALAALGGQISALGRGVPGRSTLLDDLHIPLLNADSRSVDKYDIDREAGQISRASLLSS